MDIEGTDGAGLVTVDEHWTRGHQPEMKDWCEELVICIRPVVPVAGVDRISNKTRFVTIREIERMPTMPAGLGHDGLHACAFVHFRAAMITSIASAYADDLHAWLSSTERHTELVTGRQRARSDVLTTYPIVRSLSPPPPADTLVSGQTCTGLPLTDWLNLGGPMTCIAEGRDKPLSFHWKVRYADLRKGLPMLPAVASERMERVLASIIADAMLVAAAAPSREECQRISYSRGKAFYTCSKRYFGTDYSYAFVTRAVDMLVALGVLGDHFKAKGGSFGKPKPGDPLRRQSSFLPGDCLFDIELPEIVRRRSEAVRMKDADKNLIDYRETERVHRERAFLDEVNQIIAAAEIQLDAPGAMKDGNLVRFPARQDKRSGYAVNTAMVSLYRVFNGGWSLGGRYYGGWWQSVSKEDRKAFRINGAKVIEEDFSQIHPRLLYALAGEELGARDAYTIPGYEQHRDGLCKRG
jgi:hypothetical protein